MGKGHAHKPVVQSVECFVHKRRTVQAAPHGDIVFGGKYARKIFRLQVFMRERYDPAGVGFGIGGIGGEFL